MELRPCDRHLHNVASPRVYLDRAGVLASVFCALHCAGAPLLLLFAPALGGVWAHPLSHLAIAALVVPVAVFAIRGGFAVHRRSWVLALGVAGAGLVIAGVVLPYVSEALNVGGSACDQCCPSVITDDATGAESVHVPPASVVTLLGGASLIVAHLANLRCCSRRVAETAPML